MPFDNQHFYKTHGMEHHMFWEAIADYLPFALVVVFSVVLTFLFTRLLYAQSDKKRR